MNGARFEIKRADSLMFVDDTALEVLAHSKTL